MAKTVEKEWSLHPADVPEAIERWDAGKSLFSVEMGGMGPGYEQAIQVTFIEILRGFVGRFDELEKLETREFNNVLNEYMFANEVVKKLGLSGAQAGAAKNLAIHFLRDNNWETTLGTIDKERHIQISKGFPG